MKCLDIVLRTCDRVDVHPERGPRFINVDKQTLIKKCLVSLLNSVDKARHLADIKIIIVDDNSSKETLDYIRNKIDQFQIEYKVVPCEEEGYNYSAVKQFQLCAAGREWVYCVEDDYLHFPEAITQFLIMSEKLSTITGSYVAIRPDDDVFTYSQNSPHARRPCIVLLGNDRHWRTLYTAHNTIFTHQSV